MSTRLETLIEQTDFLLEKQKEAQAEFEQIFAELANNVEEQLKAKNLSTQDSKSLNNIQTIIQDHTGKVAEQMQEDIDFLTEQLTALKHVASIPDAAKAKELLNMMIDENEEILETEEFKENVNQESTLSRQNLASIISDLKDALKEGKTHDVELFLEALQSEEESDDEGECDESDCHCCASKCNSQKDSSGVDIFKGICDDDCDCDDDCCK